jgi:hypothetical protein
VRLVVVLAKRVPVRVAGRDARTTGDRGLTSEWKAALVPAGPTRTPMGTVLMNTRMVPADTSA